MNIKIQATPFPAHSWLKELLPADYDDSFMAEWTSSQTFSSEEMLIAVFCHTPAWLATLYAMRNMLVKLLHISAKTDLTHGNGDLASSIKAGKPYGIYSVPFKSLSETVLLGKDRHLDFYLSLQVQSVDATRQRMIATTLVRYNNPSGRLYFFFVRPFHRFIVPMMIKSTILRLEGKNK